MYRTSILIFFLQAVLFVLSENSSAEVRSGFWTLVTPSAAWQNSAVDFSELSPFCSNEATGAAGCGIETADCRFTPDNRHVIARKGILFDSTLDAELRKLVTGKQMTLDWKALFYLDSMMKKMDLVAPENGYTDSLSAQKESFFIKTDDNNYALMFKIYEYYGGLDRVIYYWVYNSENGNELFKNDLITVPSTMSLSIAVNCFSGRLNPEFVVSDPEAVAQLVHAMYLSVNTLLDLTILRENTIPCPAVLGYQGLAINGRIVPYSRWESYLYSFELCEGRLTVTGDPVSSVEPLHQYYIDRDFRLEKEIIRIGCAFNLMSTAETQSVSFREVIPDSLKTDIRVSEKRRESERLSNQPQIRIMRDNKICIRNNGCDVIRIDAINLQGKNLTILPDRNVNGSFEADLSSGILKAGFYLLKIRIGGRTNVVPAVIL